jgi:hypothetical protein
MMGFGMCLGPAGRSPKGAASCICPPDARAKVQPLFIDRPLVPPTSAGQPFQEADIYSCDSKSKACTIYSAMNPGGAVAGKLALEPGKWIQAWDSRMEGKPAKQRLVISYMAPEG